MGTHKKFMQPYLHIAGSVPGDGNKVSIAMKGVLIFLLVEGLAFNL